MRCTLEHQLNNLCCILKDWNNFFVCMIFHENKVIFTTFNFILFGAEGLNYNSSKQRSSSLLREAVKNVLADFAR